MKEVKVISRQDVLDRITFTHPFPERTAIISIFGRPNDRIFPIDSMAELNLVKYINVMFSDISKWEYAKMSEANREQFGVILFNEIHAKRIIEFLDTIKNNPDEIDYLYVHCFAGVSRSGAVGTFATRYLGLDEAKFMEAHKDKIYPNETVLEVLMNLSGMKDNYLEWWKTLKQEDFHIYFNPK